MDDAAASAPGVTGELTHDRFVGDRDLTRWKTRLGRAAARLVHRLSAWWGPHAALLVTLAVGVLLFVGLAATSGVIYDSVTDKDGVAGLDKPALAAAMQVRGPVLTTLAVAFTEAAGRIGMPVIAVLGMVILAVRRRSWTPVILITAAAVGSLLMTVAGKQLIGRNRPALADAIPPYEYSPSFPSGHTLNAVVVVGVIAYLLVLRQSSRRARTATIVAAALFAVLVGLSRIYLGAHWLTDVLVAITLGIAWLAVVITAHRLYLTVRAHRHPPAAAQASAGSAAARPTATRPKNGT